VTLEEAEKIQRLFGPCTVIYECWTPEEIVQKHARDKALHEFVELAYAVDQISWEREMDLGNEETRAELFLEHTRFMADLRDRLREAGYPVKGRV
jgi:hypothetical protein